MGLIFLFGICRLEWKKKNLGLNVGKKKSGLFFFFFWLGHDLGPISKRGPRGPWGPAGAGLGPGKKPGTLNGASPGHGSCPAGRVRVWKNPARTRPVAIPTAEHGLKKSLTGKPATSVCQLMDQIDKYKQVEEDQL